MSRPLPSIPRGPAAKAQAVATDVHVLRCPRISPQWELAAQLALVKPRAYTKRAIEHKKANQPWPRNGRRVIESFLATLPARVTERIQIDFPARGADRVILHLRDLELGPAKRLARRISRLLPMLWFVLNDGYLHNGVSYLRTGKYNLELVRTNHVRLRRSVRAGFLGDIDAITSARHRAGQNEPAQ